MKNRDQRLQQINELRQLVRAVLMKNTISNRNEMSIDISISTELALNRDFMKNELPNADRDVLVRKAVAMGFEENEFLLLLDALITSMKHKVEDYDMEERVFLGSIIASMKRTFNKTSSYSMSAYKDYFEFEFDDDFDEIFLTKEEQKNKDWFDIDETNQLVEGMSKFSETISKITKMFE